MCDCENCRKVAKTRTGILEVLNLARIKGTFVGEAAARIWNDALADWPCTRPNLRTDSAHAGNGPT